MREIIDRDEVTRRENWGRSEAIDHFKKMGEHYKAEIIEDIPEGEELSIYHHGKWNGFSTGLTKYLEDDLVVIVLEHTSYNATKSLTKKIKKIVTENFVL